MRRQQLFDAREAFARFDTRHNDLDPWGDGGDHRWQLFELFWGGEVGLCQHDDRRRPRVPRQHEESLQLSRSKWAVETMHEEHDIDVRRERLLGFTFARITSYQLGSTVKYALDQPIFVIFDDGDPVTGDRSDV